MKRILYATLGALTLLLAVAIPTEAANAACGNWAPTTGEISTSLTKNPNVFTVRTTFRFTTQDIANLRCTGSSALEVDAINYDGGLYAGLVGWSSNMPGRYLDTEAFDDPAARTLTVGTQSASSLQANVDYYTEVKITEVTVSKATRTRMYLNFQRGHWASKIRNPKEAASCLSRGRQDPAWCVFADETVRMQDRQVSALGVDLNKTYPTNDIKQWGAWRRSVLTEGGRLNPGMRMVSPNGLNELVMQSDGNLVEYIPGRAVWSTQTFVPGTVAILQSDGNLVLVAPGNRPVWQSGTYKWAHSSVEIQDDRNVVVYAPGHIAVWANGTAGKP